MDVSDLNPEQIATVHEFAQALKVIRARAGLSLRQLEKEATVSRSTLSVMLGGKQLPSALTLTGFLRACGLSEEQAKPWLRTRGDLEIRRSARGPDPASAQDAAGEQKAGVSEDTGPIRVVNDRRPRRSRSTVIVAAAVVLGAAGVWGVVQSLGTSAQSISGEACRGGYQPVLRAGVAINPCIELREGQVRAAVYIKALRPSGTSGKVTAYVWLTHRDTKDKYRESLHTCPVALADNQKVVTCVRTFTPPAAGYYYTAASAQAGTDPLPPEWSPRYTGTQSPPLHWG
ncbi:helix-turn-helix domain-containing protein [Streptosporangium sp. NPDC006007]|uniref:helix-turn-helix domain-containing protein n=1 Tax=Streptosporangium sp. NPDC006007 TaxID=3154575 RepID=UPI0033AB50A0